MQKRMLNNENWLACTQLRPNQKLRQIKSLALAHLVIDGDAGRKKSMALGEKVDLI
jgi:hypothetical protein